jgi:hypothetical protein
MIPVLVHRTTSDHVVHPPVLHAAARNRRAQQLAVRGEAEADPTAQLVAQKSLPARGAGRSGAVKLVMVKLETARPVVANLVGGRLGMNQSAKPAHGQRPTNRASPPLTSTLSPLTSTALPGGSWRGYPRRTLSLWRNTW